MRDLKGVTLPVVDLLREDFDNEDIPSFELRYLKTSNLLPERLVFLRLPDMQIRRLRRETSYGIIGQVISIPVDVDTTASSFPRSLMNDYVFNAKLKKRWITNLQISAVT